MMPLLPLIVHTGIVATSGEAPPSAMPDAPGWALFLDLDGTLCHYRSDPARVALDVTQAEVLRSLSLRLDGALCVISGRAGNDLERVLGDLPVQRIGAHGLPGGEVRDPATRAALEEAAEALELIVAGHPDTWLERKPAGCALHYRDAPQFAERLTRALRCASDRWPLLRLLEGHCVLELIPREANKGLALRERMRQEPFAGRVPVVAGDDVTDEDAFVAARIHGGFGIAVGARRSPAARFRLADPDALNAWLRGLAYAPRETLHA
jgi:trehalose 6-phosphate phosphatase